MSLPAAIAAASSAASSIPGLTDGGVPSGGIGTITVILVAAALALVKFLPKLNLERQEAGAGATLYSNLASHIDRLTADFESLRKDRDILFQQNTELKATLGRLVTVEKHNDDLRATLERREEEVRRMFTQLSQLSDQMRILTDRNHKLEMRQARVARVPCPNCGTIITHQDIAEHDDIPPATP